MRRGRLFPCGDAAHIVLPTGAKGAASCVDYLWTGLSRYDPDHDRHCERALARAWKARRFSWWFTPFLQQFPDNSAFDLRVQRVELAFLSDSEATQATLAVSCAVLPYCRRPLGGQNIFFRPEIRAETTIPLNRLAPRPVPD